MSYPIVIAAYRINELYFKQTLFPPMPLHMGFNQRQSVVIFT